MSLVLAIEPDARQAGILRQLLRDRLGSDVELVASKAAALAALDRNVPDLVLVSALLSPRDEDDIVTYLRSLNDAAHLQTLTIPRLRRADELVCRMSLFDKLLKRRSRTAASGCDPVVFAEEVSSYLARARELRRERQVMPLAHVAAAPVPTPAAAPPGAPQQAGAPSVPVDEGKGQVKACEAAMDVENAPLQAEEDDSIDEIDRLIRSLGVNPKSIQTVEVDGFAEADTPAIAEVQTDNVEALEAELARVRAETEARLRAEIECVRKEFEDALVAEHFEAAALAGQIRQASAREAREIAEAAASRALKMEIGRIRADAEPRLVTDVAANPKPLSIICVQSNAAAQPPSSAISGGAPVAATPAADIPSPAIAATDYYSLWRTETAKPAQAQATKMCTPTCDRIGRTKWVLPVAASLLLLAGDTISVDVAALVGSVRAALVGSEPAEPESIVLTPPKTTGALQVQTTPSGARIRLDGGVVGQSPLTLREVAAGRHTLVIDTSTGAVTRTIAVRPGETTSVTQAIFPADRRDSAVSRK